MLSVSVFASGAAGYGTRTVYADTRREGDIVYLDAESSDVSDDTVNDWAVEAGLIEEPVDSESICTKMDLIRVLWLRNCIPEYKADALTTKIKDVSKEDTYAALWAYKKGISAIDAQKNFKPKTQLTHGDVLQTLWFINGKPVASGDITGFENLDTSSTYYPAALWAAD